MQYATAPHLAATCCSISCFAVYGFGSELRRKNPACTPISPAIYVNGDTKSKTNIDLNRVIGETGVHDYIALAKSKA